MAGKHSEESNKSGGSEQGRSHEMNNQSDRDNASLNKGGRQSQQYSRGGTPQESGGARRGSGGFANDSDKADEAARKGGHGTQRGSSK